MSAILEALPPEDAEYLRRQLALPDTASRLSVALRDAHHISVTASVLRRHAARGCKCPV